VIVDGIERGIITATTKERLVTLEAEKIALEQAPVEQPLPSIHPNLAKMYRGKVARLEQELTDPEVAADAKSLLRSMISTIVITPAAKRGQIALELHGELAAILAMTQGKKNKGGTPPSRLQVSVVAGARSHLYRTKIRVGC
jgi:site-specific DNA recombinase